MLWILALWAYHKEGGREGGLVGAIALLYPSRVRVRATAKLSAAFFHDESSIIKVQYESGTKVQ